MKRGDKTRAVFHYWKTRKLSTPSEISKALGISVSTVKAVIWRKTTRGFDTIYLSKKMPPDLLRWCIAQQKRYRVSAEDLIITILQDYKARSND